jgi:hypothetical protein
MIQWLTWGFKKGLNKAQRQVKGTLKILYTLTDCLLPMRIALILVTEAALACCAPCVLQSGLEMALHLIAGSEAKQTGETHELMSNTVVVLEVVLETPIILEGRKTEVAVGIMVP